MSAVIEALKMLAGRWRATSCGSRKCEQCLMQLTCADELDALLAQYNGVRE